MESIATSVAHYLVPWNEEPLAGHVLLVDKYSIQPLTTFVSQEFLNLCSSREGIVEYKQANLQNPGTCCPSYLGFPALAYQLNDLPTRCCQGDI